MYVYRNMEECSCNNCCSGEAISITYSEHVFVALGIQHAHAPYCHLWPDRLYNIFTHYLINSTSYKKKLLNIKLLF